MRVITSLIALALAQGALALPTFHGNNARTGVYDASAPRQLSGVKWVFKTDGPGLSSPAVRDGIVYVGTSDTHRFHALDARTGRLVFAYDAKALIFGSAALSGGLALVGAFNGSLSAIDVKSGNAVWQFRTDASRQDPLKVLTADGGLDASVSTPLFHNFLDMTLYLYNTFSVSAIASSPVVDHGAVFFGSADGNVYAIH
jgi:outer membrane protein assembly factor BamB